MEATPSGGFGKAVPGPHSKSSHTEEYEVSVIAPLSKGDEGVVMSLRSAYAKLSSTSVQSVATL
ncbi:hypothetical protein GCM10010358_01000 [Streptomyces minutiscleroticus]|uniref:Uncharacterized protein n=1 Tax=Streptomyces minutiscleroticus TaxID=68238 RepID=A0A918K5Q9_9ACTN|nr:hypothetical protein GCM10010358_01000 [Streptomyces minutiscleroticus]